MRGHTDTLIKKISFKLCALLALTISSRTLGLHHLEIRNTGKTDNKGNLHFHKLHKSWRKGKPLPSLPVHAPPDEEQWVTKSLVRYLEAAKNR